ncbi:MAG: GGDEF domain-containing protein [Chloroherpetonaceae bacterium]
MCSCFLIAAVIACEKVRAVIETFDWSQIHPDLKITISIGICGDTNQPSFENMLSIADQHLYRAKQNGRNQVYYRFNALTFNACA